MEQPSIDELKASLKKHAQAFDELLRLIPPKFYLPEEHAQILNNRYMKNTKKDTETKKKSEQRKARASAKSARLDPDNARTVQDMQSAKLEKLDKTKNKLAHTNGNIASNGSSVSGGDDWEDIDDGDAPSSTKMAIDVDGTGEEAQNQLEANTDAIKPMPPAQSINDLRDRLQARIQSLRQKRKAPEDDGSREALLEKRMKRRENTKEAKAKAKKSAGGVVKEQVLGKNTPGSNDSGSGGFANGEGSVKNNVLFGKLVNGTQKKKKSIQVKQQLANIEGKKKDLEELRKVDANKANELEEKDKWSKALGLAKGEKVKDDVKLLRKTVRREEQKKRKSSREWSDRKKDEKKKLKERTDKREANIKARVDAKKMKKQGKSKKSIARVIKGSKDKGGFKKKGPAQKARPGFEGKASKK
ncbi:hypothetical protein IW140_004848 [Coemansia sp. RSA 1813]|nr:hypothetical protein EV178_004894 [Coemansia sp. RSA 1646]KAJ1769505.1 hypothetical protein LPJ74_003991 [Coemansia sp. RSA 1843]KAJ2087480.1 hypothetical protein IW138_004940 [Coemansia sp. RSA 986]KAJ2211701.1 hypothetical protein EV179_005258 [Coemansia sp. RSA 487]KAJ2566660.1 hypothetical protein IW140_004848 [Coemansia sp. RSA 1813]